MANYQGIYYRHYLGQKPGQTGTAWSDSPDIVLAGKQPFQDPSVLTSQSGYDQDFGSDVYMEQINYVYLRGINTSAGSDIARVWLYYVESDLMLWPQNWRSDNIQVVDPISGEVTVQNYSLVTAQDPNEIVATTTPFLWTPPKFQSGASEYDHYCMVACADNNVDPNDPNPTHPLPQGHFGSCDQLAQFIMANPNMAWRNTIDINAELPSWQRVVSVTGPPDGGQFSIGVALRNMPKDGYFEYSVPGPDSDNTIIVPKTSVANWNSGLLVSVTWPPGFYSTMTITYYSGPSGTPDNATISAVVKYDLSSDDNLFREAPERFAALSNRPNLRDHLVLSNIAPSPKDISKVKPTYAIPIGSIPFRMTKQT